jgi:hypothetical protein
VSLLRRFYAWFYLESVHNPMRALKLLGIPLLVLGMASSVASQTCLLYIDNGSDEALQVTSDDGQHVAVPRHDVGSLQIRTGHRAVTVTAAGGKIVEQRSFDAGRRWDNFRRRGHAYVLNVGGQNTYVIASAGYGRPGDPLRTLDPTDHLFALPDDVDDAFLQPLPVALDVVRDGDLMRRVYHRPVHQDRPCCRPIRESLTR